MYEIRSENRVNGTTAKLDSAHWLAEFTSRTETGSHIYVNEVGNRDHLLGDYLNGNTLIKLTD